MAPGLIFLFFGAMVVFAIVSVKRQMDATNAEWARAARTLGLSFTPWSMTSRPDLSGAVDGLGVRVTIEQRGSGKSKKSYTVFRVAYPDAGIDIGIGPETAFHRMGKWFGVQDIEIGDPVFDEAFIVAGDPSSLAGWLTESRRLAILRLAQGFPTVRIDRSTVSWDRRDAITDGDELVRTLRRLASATHLVAGSAPAQQVVDRSFEAARLGQLAVGIDQLAGVDSPIGVEPRLMAAEWMVADGRVDQAAPLLDELAEDLPGEPQVEHWRAVLDRHQAEVPGVEAPAVTTGPSRPLDEVIEGLFGGDPYGYEIQERFQGSFDGTAVHGTGVLERLTPYSSDYDFSGRSGVKALVRVGTIEHRLYGEVEIDVVLALPDDTRIPLGSTISVEGTLVKVDPLLRNLYVRGTPV
ncbi:MAG: hypothetical protein ACERLM_06110 [Acidimicrobiales bacterium]